MDHIARIRILMIDPTCSWPMILQNDFETLIRLFRTHHAVEGQSGVEQKHYRQEASHTCRPDGN